MHNLNNVSAIKKITIREPKDFIYENYYRRMGFARENRYYSMKYRNKKDLQLFATKVTQKKIPDSGNAKERYNSYFKRKKHKIGKAIKHFLKNLTFLIQNQLL